MAEPSISQQGGGDWSHSLGRALIDTHTEDSFWIARKINNMIVQTLDYLFGEWMEDQ